MVKVSVIIPVYNTEEYLKECLDSVINQTLKDIEIICIDDGSTDNSPEILEEYARKDSRIKVIKTDNKGAPFARNTGLKLAAGKYIGFIDSDDWIDLNYYETLYTKAIETDADVVRTTIKEIYPDKITEPKINELIQKRFQKKQLLKKNEHWTVIWHAIYKLDFMRDNNIDYFDEELPMCHDVPFTARIDLSAKKSVPVCGTYYYYRRERERQLIAPSVKRTFCVLQSMIITTNYLNSIKLPKKVYKKAYKKCLNSLEYAFKQGIKLNEFNFEMQNKFLAECNLVTNNYKYNKRKIFNYEETTTHIIITLFGIKFKFQALSPPPKFGNIVKNLVFKNKTYKN